LIRRGAADIKAKHMLDDNREIGRQEGSVMPAESTPPDSSLDSQRSVQRNGAFEKALRESEERFCSAMNNMAEGLYTIDTEGLVTYVNPSAESLFGWTADELLGKKMHDVTHYKHSDGSPFPAAECEGLRVMQKGVELRDHQDVFIRKDGSFFPVVFSASPLKKENRTAGVVVCFRDDTKRQQAEERLRQSERIYRAIGESIDYGVWICDAQGRNIYASPSFLKLVGLTQEQCSESGWTHVLHPEDAHSTVAAWQECIRSGAFWEREHRFRSVDGTWRHILARGVPIRDARGSILYWAGINLDDQHRKEAEQQMRVLVQSLEARVAERTGQLANASEKLRELSAKLMQTQDEERRRIARELHDGVGQLLAAMNMQVSRVTLEESTLPPKIGHVLNETLRLIEDASREIRTMSHLLHPPLLDEVGLESALHWYVEGFAERSKIKVKTQLAPGFSTGLPRELSLSLFRIVQECLTNVHRHSESATALVKVVRASNEITLEVADAGKGIPPDIQTSFALGACSGVGLRGMRERIRQFDGRLDVQSGLSGTRIVAVVPLAGLLRDETKGAFEESPSEMAIDAGNAGNDAVTILCIDDEPDGLLPRRLLLESAGYRVIQANSGPEGIRLFQTETVDAVILDYWMSGMKGTAVASELKRINSGVPIIVLSGMSDLPGEASGLIDQWIVKGSTRAEQLLSSINSLLERRPGS
jgi:PAS domain S-box-containing protein